MDLAELEAKFHALKKLYGLLLKNYEDTSHLSSDKLDDGARFMLKKLLDMESDRIIKAHSEIVERKGVKESCSSKLLKNNTMNEKFRAGEVPFQSPIGDREDLTTDLILRLREEQNLCDPASQGKEVNQSDVICTAGAFEHGKKICRVCSRRKSKPSNILSDHGAQTPKAVNDLHPTGSITKIEEHNKRGSDDDSSVSFVELSGGSKEKISSVGGPNYSSSDAISESSSSHSAAETSKKGTNSLSKKDADFVSIEALDAVGKILSHITDLKLDTQSLLPPRKRPVQFGLGKISAGMMPSAIDRNSPSMLVKGGKAVADTASSQALMGQMESQQNIRGNSGQSVGKQNPEKIVPSLVMRTPSHKFESLCDRIVPVDRLPNQNHRVRGFEFQEQVSNKSKWRKIPTARYISQMNKEDWDKQVCSAKKKLVDRTPHTVGPSRVPSVRQHSRIKSPRLSTAEHESSQPSVSSLHDSLLDQHKKLMRRTSKEPMDHEETESTDSDYSASTNELSSDSLNEIDLNSGSAEIYTSETASSRSESDDVDSLQRRTRHLPAGSTGSSETEVYSSASRSDTEIYSSSNASGFREDTATSSNERQSYTSHVRPGTSRNQEQKYSSDDYESSRQSGRVHSNPSQNSRNRKRRGGLKKLKDKLGIIFHHHHHHHHHVHHNDKNNQKNSAPAKNRGKSLWKRSKKVTDLERKKEIKGEHAVEKSMVRGGERKNQRGHFNELVKGFLRHKRQSKGSKSSKLACKRARINRESKKAPSKSHWWKVMKNQKRSKLHKKHILLK